MCPQSLKCLKWPSGQVIQCINHPSALQVSTSYKCTSAQMLKCFNCLNWTLSAQMPKWSSAWSVHVPFKYPSILSFYVPKCLKCPSVLSIKVPQHAQCPSSVFKCPSASSAFQVTKCPFKCLSFSNASKCSNGLTVFQVPKYLSVSKFTYDVWKSIQC